MSDDSTNEGGTFASFGEESPKKLAKAAKPHRTRAVPRVDSTNPKARNFSDTPTAKKPAKVPPSSVEPVPAKAQIEIVRATTKFRIEPWRLAQDSKAHRNRTCDRACEACLLLHSLWEIRDDCVSAINQAMRMYRRIDEDALDDFIDKHGRKPKNGKEWSMPQSKAGTDFNVYGTITKNFPDVATGIMSLIARRANQKWSQDRWKSLIWNKCAPPHFKETMPLPIRAQEVRLGETGDPEMFVFGFSLHAMSSSNRVGGGRGPEFELPVRAYDSRQKQELKALASGDWRIGDALLEQDRLRRGRWYLKISYTRVLVHEKAKTKKYAAINRGIFGFLVSVTDEEDEWLYEANDIVAYLKQVQARRRQYQRASNASSRDGHGHGRYLLPLRKLEDQGTRWRETRIKQLTRRYVTWLQEKNVTDLVISNFSAGDGERGIRDSLPEKLEGGKYVWDLIQEWPYLQLQTRLEHVCEEVGITVHLVSPAYVSQTCPRCEHVDEESIRLQWRQFACTNCGWKRHVDITAAMNLLERHAGIDACAWAFERREKKRKKGDRRKNVR